MTTEREDPFDQLIAACQIALGFVAERIDNADAQVARASEAKAKRLDQQRRIEAAIGVLTGEKPLKGGAKAKAPRPQAVPGAGRTGGIPACPNCGAHPASKVHRETCLKKTEAAEAPAPLVEPAPAVEAS